MHAAFAHAHGLPCMRAVVTAPIQKQQMNFSRNFYLTKDVDVTIQT